MKIVSTEKLLVVWNPDLIFEQADVVVGGLRVHFSFSLQVELQSLHVEPEVSGVWVTLRWITGRTQRQDGHGGRTNKQQTNSWDSEVILWVS